ncbi:MAG: hypothetical protein N2485_06800 [bacterium]|nr:hypothetical protein [bacterium]
MVKPIKISKIILNSVDSTQEYLKKEIQINYLNQNQLKIIVVNAFIQYKGKGSNNRSWVSLRGGLYLSVNFPLSILSEKIPKKYFNLISVFIGTIVLKSILSFSKYLSSIFNFNEILNLQDDLKNYLRVIFPNDIVLVENDNIYKLGGILIETFKDNLIIGIGINLLNEIEDYFEQNKNIFDHYPISLKTFILKKFNDIKYNEDIKDIIDFFSLKNLEKVISILGSFIYNFLVFYLINFSEEIIKSLLNDLVDFDYTPYLKNIKVKYIETQNNVNKEVEEIFYKIIPDYNFLIFKVIKNDINNKKVDVIDFSKIRRIFY